MMPGFRRSALFLLLATLAVAISALTGCSGSLMHSRSQSPEHADASEEENATKLVGDFADPNGINFVKVEGAVLITGLANTGSDPPPGPQRSAILADMQAHGVVNPNRVLSSTSTSVAWAIGYIPPGVRKGDRFDVEVRVPANSETTSLHGGWMMETRLMEKAVIAGHVLNGHVLATAEGPVLVDPISHDTADPVSQLKGIVLGGAVANKSRSLGLVLRASDKSVYLSKQIGDAVNRRFHTFIKGMKQGVATPKTDEYIELEIHPRYKYNLTRYIRVIRSIAVLESPEQLLQRIDLLERQLLDPVTSAQAALRLEAVGKDGIRVLKVGLESKDSEVKFYAAEALAYLDEPSCVPVLTEAAKNEPAFRAYALTALSALNDIHASDALHDLFDVASAETRYGAFRALWAMNERDPQLHGEHLSDKFWLHIIPSTGPAMVHVTHSSRPEIVVFGEGQQFNLPMTVDAGNTIIVKSQSDGKISIARFAVNQPDKRQVVENSVEAVIRGITEVGGDYPDVVQALQQARANGALDSRFEVDAIPERGRIFDRNRRLAQAEKSLDALTAAHGARSRGAGSADAGDSKTTGTDAEDGRTSGMESSDPLPNLFGGGAPKFDDSPPKGSDGVYPTAAETDEKPAEDSSKSAAHSDGFWVK
jgi:flagellar basal body P-ring protein FlgI